MRRKSIKRDVKDGRESERKKKNQNKKNNIKTCEGDEKEENKVRRKEEQKIHV